MIVDFEMVDGWEEGLVPRRGTRLRVIGNHREHAIHNDVMMHMVGPRRLGGSDKLHN